MKDLGQDRIQTPGALSSILPELYARYPAAAVARQLDALARHGDLIDDPELWLRTALAGDFKFMPLEAIEQCACGSRDSTLLSRFIFWNLLALRECRSCGLLFVSPRLAPEAMRRVFEEHYFDHSDPDFWGRRRVPIFQEVIRYLRRYGCRSVFDVGAAYGHFVAWAEREGLVAAGCDISAAAVERGRSTLGVQLYHGILPELGLPAESYDAVVSLDTLYYAPDPVAELRSMRRLVRPGGYLVLRLRNGLRTLARARREGQKRIGGGVLPAEHIWAFTPAAIMRLLQRCDLQVCVCEAAAYSRTPISPVHALAVRLNRWARGALPSLPILTQSFNVVAQRPPQSDG